MILESKSGKFAFILLGIALLATAIYGGINLNDLQFNFCKSDKIEFLNIINQLLIVLMLLFALAGGLISFWWVKYSICECRKFQEEKIPIQWKKLSKQIIAYLMIIIVISLAVIILNNFVFKDRQIKDEWRKKRDINGLTEREKVIRIQCVGKIVNFTPKSKWVKSKNWQNFIGTATMKLTEPESLSGRILTIKISNIDYKKNWKEKDEIIRFSALKGVLISGKTINSNRLRIREF